MLPVSWTGFVMPLIDSLPGTATKAPSGWKPSDAKVISGACSASKNSGDARCAPRFSSCTWMLSTLAKPESVAMPFSSTVSVASKGANEPWNVPAR